MSTALRALSMVRSTLIEVSAKGWQRGMRSAVRLAAMIPAGQPRHGEDIALLHLAGGDEGQCGGLHQHAARGGGAALGFRLGRDIDHGGLALGVEMGEARHQAVRVFSSGPAPGAGAWRRRHRPRASGIRRSGRSRRRRDAGGPNPPAREPALGNQEPVAGQAGGQALRHRKIDRQGLEIAVVDADEARREPKGALELGLVMHLDQRVHAEPDAPSASSPVRPRRPPRP